MLEKRRSIKEGGAKVAERRRVRGDGSAAGSLNSHGVLQILNLRELFLKKLEETSKIHRKSPLHPPPRLLLSLLNVHRVSVWENISLTHPSTHKIISYFMIQTWKYLNENSKHFFPPAYVVH
jgi:hypothetical protein